MQEDEDDFGTQGRKSRRKRERREKASQGNSCKLDRIFRADTVTLVLRGSKAFELYLQAYQLILWNQCHWLIHVKGFPAALEFLVHDLWAVRLQLLKARVEEHYDPDTPSQVFSTQSELDPSTEAEETERSGRGSKGKDMPTLRDTLGLCYLATLLLRLPVSIGDFHRSVKLL